MSGTLYLEFEAPHLEGGRGHFSPDICKYELAGGSPVMGRTLSLEEARAAFAETQANPDITSQRPVKRLEPIRGGLKYVLPPVLQGHYFVVAGKKGSLYRTNLRSYEDVFRRLHQAAKRLSKEAALGAFGPSPLPYQKYHLRTFFAYLDEKTDHEDAKDVMVVGSSLKHDANMCE